MTASSRLDRMRTARRIPQVTLQRYNQIRSKSTGKLMFVFEGDDDVSFYDCMLSKQGFCIEYVPMVCNGKDFVLELREIMSRNVSRGAKDVYFFIDKDFDGLKGYSSGNDLYCTPTYSIENILVSVDTLELLMRGEYRCNDEDGNDDIANIKKLYCERLSEFLAAMKDANQLIHYARTTGLLANQINNDIKKYVHITLNEVMPVCLVPLWQLVGLPNVVSFSELSISEQTFKKLEPVREWRGKFLYSFFQKFLADLKEDRGSKSPKHFRKRANMSFSPQSDMIRTLAAIAPTPQCLAHFAQNISSPRDSGVGIAIT